ncbi:hypothetical protein D3C71_1369990 [compost metagenome]
MQLGKPVDELHAIHVRHIQVYQHQVVRQETNLMQRGLGGRGHIRLAESCRLQQIRQVDALERVVVHDQNSVVGQLLHHMTSLRAIRA